MAEKRSKNGPRSNLSLLPFDLQWRIVAMIQDGATALAIADDAEVKAAYAAIGATFNRSAMTRIKRSKVYADWTQRRIAEKTALAADRVTTAILAENATLDTIAEQTKVALLKVVQEAVSAADDTKEVERLVRSAVALANTAKDNRISELTRKLDDKKRELEAALETLDATRQASRQREAELNRRIAALEAAAPGVDGSVVAEAMKKKFGLADK